MAVLPAKEIKVSYETVNKKVKEIIYQVAEEQGIVLDGIEDEQAIVDDLGFASLDVATLAALFEEAFQVDPFSTGIASVTTIRTVRDVTTVYEKAIKLLR
jgi:acyl carrier protein